VLSSLAAAAFTESVELRLLPGVTPEGKPEPHDERSIIMISAPLGVWHSLPFATMKENLGPSERVRLMQINYVRHPT
jgi:hypothetical protein